VVILDENESTDLPQGVRHVVGVRAFEALDTYDMVVRTPSMQPDRLCDAKKVWSVANEFLEKCPAQIVGVTGTKGKGTTSSLIAAILREAGKSVHLLGNIGVPALDVLPKVVETDIVVYEMSSFQLWDLERSPHVAVVLMVEPDHLNVHADFNDYVAAKANIARHQHADDILVYHPSNSYSAKIAQLSVATTKMRYLSEETAHIVNGVITIDGKEICAVDEVGLKGEYNLQNICAAIAACWSFTQDVAAIKRAVTQFRGLQHRLEFVAAKGGVDYYNDSYSSTPTAAIAALTAFDTPLVLIVGGYDKQIDLSPLATAIIASKNIKKVIVMGQVNEKLAALFEAEHFDNYINLGITDFRNVVNAAVENAVAGDTILLSPGCASFDMFKNMSDRGEQFKQLVGEMNE
jgi:UDP-N-acetylmuramoylalanine--D-glutamate ligase